MPPCENRTRPTSNCLSCRPALAQLLRWDDANDAKAGSFRGRLFLWPLRRHRPARCTYLRRNPFLAAVHTRYVHKNALLARSNCTYLRRGPLSIRRTYRVCTRKRPPSAFQMYIPPQKHCPTPCTYQVCTRKRPPSAFQMYIPPPKPIATGGQLPVPQRVKENPVHILVHRTTHNLL